MVGRVVDDEVEWRVAELGFDDLGEAGGIGLVDAVEGANDIGEPVRLGELGQRRGRLRLEVDGDDLARFREEREQRGAATLGDAELEDRPAPELLADRGTGRRA